MEFNKDDQGSETPGKKKRGRKKGTGNNKSELPGRARRAKTNIIGGREVKKTEQLDDIKVLARVMESVTHDSITCEFNRQVLPELYQEVQDPKEALKAYISHLVLCLTPRKDLLILAARVCPNKELVNLLHQQILTEMTFDFRAQDRIQLEGYFKQILEMGMYKALQVNDLKSFFSGAKLMKDLFGIETKKIIRAEIGGKTPAELFSKEFIASCVLDEDSILTDE